jgi:putative tryptophan/tyrosine transport system substrate-binding protein
MRRPEFLGFVGGAAAWPVAARAQQADRIRRIRALMNLSDEDPESRQYVGTFLQGMRDAGWIEHRNLHIEYRWSASDQDCYCKYDGPETR